MIYSVNKGISPIRYASSRLPNPPNPTLLPILLSTAMQEPIWKPDAYKPEEEKVKKDATWINSKTTEDELEEVEDDFIDDRELEALRQKRLEELRRGPIAGKKPKFGSLEPINSTQFVAEVTNAGQDIWVVCHLYKDSVQDCSILNQIFTQLAKDYPETKFLKIISTDCIPGYPDDNLPTVLLYKNTKCKKTLVGLGEFGGRSTSVEMTAIMLNRWGDVCGGEESHEKQVKGLIGRLLAEKEGQEKEKEEVEDEDSDFE
jgi:hypothetical protein